MAADGKHQEYVHTGYVVLDIGQGVGALTVLTGPDRGGAEIEVSRDGGPGRIHTEVHERVVNGRTVFAGVFPDLPAGDYTVWVNDPRARQPLSVREGEVAELDLT